ncbi:MAG: hypothetical protein JWR38_2765 [Mucilaginibacter sp.]|nr:hypothetical protein [Mucilaginibacter sp.]
MPANHTKFSKSRLFILSVVLGLLCCFTQTRAQSLLEKRVSVNFDHAPLGNILREVGKKGGFYFFYKSDLLPQDSLVSIIANNQTISGVLSTLFHGKYDFTEHKEYLVISQRLSNLSLINTDITTENNTYSISGLVVNERTGERLMNASVYVKEQLVSALTDEHGYFQLRFRANNPGQISLTASKLSYKDTSINFLQAVSVSSRSQTDDYNNATNKSNGVEKTGMGRFLISAKQRIQSLNIPDFFARRPFQISLTPGLSSHGMFSPQVVNKFSLNLVGGYTAGVNGIEFGGLFNINRMNSRYLQLAGIFNMVGGTVTGLQVAGVHNRALDTVKGVQIAGFINKAEGQMAGLQLSALTNSAHKLKGVQIGLVNTADTSQGASIGLVNIIGNGFYKVTLSTSDLTNTNVSLKTGTHTFYSALLVGINLDPNNKLYTIGLGMGHDFMLSNKVYVSAEAAYNFVDAGNWDNRLIQGKLLLNVQLSKNISLFAGPTFNRYNSSSSYSVSGYKNVNHLPVYTYTFLTQDPDPGVYISSHRVKKWMGWEAGIAFNSVFKPAPKVADYSSAWYLGAAITTGKAFGGSYGHASGVELFTHRDLGEHLTGTLSTGYSYFPTPPFGLYILSSGPVYQPPLQPIKIIPVKAGIRLKTGKAFFIAGEIGEAFGLFNDYAKTGKDSNGYPEYGLKPYRSFMYAVSAGFSFKSGLETGFKLEDYSLGGDYHQFALRLGYRLRLSK